MLHSDQIRTGPIMPAVLRVGLGVWMSALIVVTFLFVPAAKGFAAPEAARLVVFHVPCAMVSVLAYIVSTVYAVAFLRSGKEMTDTKSAIAAGLGFLFTVLATVTGMVFAKLQWGVAWDWSNIRMTSILMLMMVYAAYFALRSSLPGTRARGKISAAYNILAGLVMIFLVFVLPRMFGEGPHPNDTLTTHGGLSPEYRVALSAAMVGYIWLVAWMFRVQVRVAEYMLAARRVRVE